MNMPDLTLLRPFWLLAPPLILWLAFRLRRLGGLGDWRRAVDPHLLAALERRGAVVPATGRRALPAWLAAAALIGLALAGPAMERTDAGTFRNLDGLVFAIDVSRSVSEGGELRASRLAAQQIAEAAGSRQVALVLYAGDAYLAAPFSADREALRPLLASEAVDLVPDAGNAPARAIAFADALFARAGMLGGDIVLVTDGGGLDAAALDAAGKVRAQGRRLYVLFIAPDAAVDVAADAAARAVVRTSGGSFATVRNPEIIADEIAKTPAQRLGASAYSALVWSDLGRYALILAAMPLLIVFRRRA